MLGDPLIIVRGKELVAPDPTACDHHPAACLRALAMHPMCKERLRTWLRVKASPTRLSRRVRRNGAGCGIPPT